MFFLKKKFAGFAEKKDRKMGVKESNTMPLISKMYCSSSETVLLVRKRPRVVNGGGFVVSDSEQKVVFKVDVCGSHGTKGELILRDGDGNALLLMRRKAGLVEALSINKKWKGYTLDYDGWKKLAFSLKEHKSSVVKNNVIRISTEPRTIRDKDWDFEISGFFPDKDCSLVDSCGHVIAQVGPIKEVEVLMQAKDVYHVVVKPGIDRAIVFGVIAILDYIHGESTCS